MMNSRHRSNCGQVVGKECAHAPTPSLPTTPLHRGLTELVARTVSAPSDPIAPPLWTRCGHGARLQAVRWIVSGDLRWRRHRGRRGDLSLAAIVDIAVGRLSRAVAGRGGRVPATVGGG